MISDIDACRLAFLLAQMAVLAFRGVDDRTEERKSGEETQRRTDGTDGVAVGPSVLPCENNNCDEGYGGYNEGRKALEPYLFRIEGLAVGFLGKECEEVVAPLIEGGEDVLDDSAI